MCGIAGFLFLSGTAGDTELRDTVRDMTRVLHHRGPDSTGLWVEASSGIALGHARLAIIDLSQNGAQPMESSSGRYHIVFNGEIYNYRSISEDLRNYGVQFRGHSDTEVILAAIETWGLESALKRTVGMFAIALWDQEKQTLSLARDRIGEKPIYYGLFGDRFVFASELRSFLVCPDINLCINQEALSLYLQLGYVPGPHSIYQGVQKLPAGKYIQIPRINSGKPHNASPGSYATSDNSSSVSPEAYWALDSQINSLAGRKAFFDDTTAISKLDQVLRESLRGQMIADVPLGAFLSGGIDSSLVVALMSSESSRPVKTFTIGFEEKMFNEAEHAKCVARHLGTEHTEYYLSANDALNVIPELSDIYDEPFADSSQIPMTLVSRIARKHVTVALSGDGGDELFCGYNRYFWSNRLSYFLASVPKSIRTLVGNSLLKVSPKKLDNLVSWLAPVFAGAAILEPGKSGARLHKMGSAIKAADSAQLYLSVVSYWKEAEKVLQSGRSADVPWLQRLMGSGAEYIEQMQYWDQIGYLPDDNLVKVDRASMHSSLEVRAPLLDHRVVEFAWSLPANMKYRDGQSKWILRKLLYKYVPKSMVERPKMGFSVPISQWLRGPLRAWAEDLLDDGKLSQEGVFRPEVVRRVWDAHLAGHVDAQNELWAVLMFQSWKRKQLAGINSACRLT